MPALAVGEDGVTKDGGNGAMLQCGISRTPTGEDNVRLATVVVAAVLLWTIPAVCQVPDEFVVHQNNPNPFCPHDSPGGTTILFEMPQAAYITLEVLTPDTLGVERSLIAEYLPAGLHAVTWDGRDNEGDIVGDGVYPYLFVAADSPGGAPLFQDMLFATASCPTPTDGLSWGILKRRFCVMVGPTAN